MLSRQTQTHKINRIQFSDTFANVPHKMYEIYIVHLYSPSSKSVDKEYLKSLGMYVHGIIRYVQATSDSKFCNEN